MKSIKFLFALLILTISLVACDAGNEPLDPALLNQLPVTDTCVTPTNLQTSPLNNGTTINLTWTTSGIATAWQVEYGLSETYIQGAGTKIPASAATVGINNLFAVNSYTFSVRAICGSGFGDWSNPVNVVGINPNCANPSGLSVLRSTTNPAEATVNWTAPATQTAWEISYGAVGYNPSQGTNTVQATTKPKTVSGLATTSYDFYVRAKCSATETSNWVGPIKLAAVTITNPVTGDYWPMTLNNSWTYKKDGVIQTPMKIISSETIEGNLYYKYDSFFGSLSSGGGTQSSIWTRKSNNIYYYRTSTTGTSPAGAFTIAPYDVIILKSELNVNETWTQNVTQVTTYVGIPAINTVITFTGKILEKNATLTVNGVTYNNVIKSELAQSYFGGNSLNTYWFASGVGPIKVTNEIGGTVITQELNSKIIN